MTFHIGNQTVNCQMRICGGLCSLIGDCPTQFFGEICFYIRKVTKAKSVFPTDDSLLKMLYLAMMDITKKWTGRRQDWSLIHAQLAVFFADRMPD